MRGLGARLISDANLHNFFQFEYELTTIIDRADVTLYKKDKKENVSIIRTIFQSHRSHRFD